MYANSKYYTINASGVVIVVGIFILTTSSKQAVTEAGIQSEFFC